MRDIRQLHPELQRKATELIDICAQNGLKIKIGECMRTAKEQDDLYAQGRTKQGKRVTNCKGSSYSSMHQWGVAFDFYRADGRGAYDDKDGFFTKVGKLGHNIGLEWGGSWKSPVDKPHFQLPDWGSTATLLKRTYGTPEKFMQSWQGVPNTPPQTIHAVSPKGIDYSAVFDAAYYAEHHADLRAAFGNNETALQLHFVNYGMKENRRACVEFDPVAYRYRYIDLQKAFGDDYTAYYLHYIQHGKSEGRKGN